MKKINKWFKPGTRTGWKKTDPPSIRRAKLLATTTSKTFYKKLLEAARRSMALSNVTTDPETKIKAKQDAYYYYATARKYKQILKKKQKKQRGTTIYAEKGKDFQEYVYKDGTNVPPGTPIGTEHKGEIKLKKNIYYKN